MDKVVVIVSTEQLYDEEVGAYVARIAPLGLTGYGDTQDAALRKVKRMFASVTGFHRSKGDLEEWLNGSGLEWHHLSEYRGSIPIEEVYATEKEAALQPQRAGSTRFTADEVVGMAA